MKKTVFAYIILGICIILASVSSSFLNPMGMLRAFIAACILTNCFYLLNYKHLNRLTLSANIGFYIILACVLMYLLPFSYNDSEFFKYLKTNTDTIKVLSLMRTAGYFIVLLGSNLLAVYLTKKKSDEPEKRRKSIFALTLFAFGTIGGTIVSSINLIILDIFSPASGLAYSSILYFGFFVFVMLNKIPEKLVNKEL